MIIYVYVCVYNAPEYFNIHTRMYAYIIYFHMLLHRNNCHQLMFCRKCMLTRFIKYSWANIL